MYYKHIHNTFQWETIMQESEMLSIANEIAGPHGLTASFLLDENCLSVGVGGDNRTYTRIIMLEGPFPGHKILADVSTKLSNLTGINRVTFDLTPATKETP